MSASTACDLPHQVPYLELQPIAVTGENMDEVIIKGGFHAMRMYLNVNRSLHVSKVQLQRRNTSKTKGVR